MALAKDEGTGAGRGRNLDTHLPGKVLYRSDFDAGFDGWTDHWGGENSPVVPVLAVSRTSEISYRGSHSLMLSTGSAASPLAGDISNTCSSFKRMARCDSYRYHHYSAFVGIGVGGNTDSWTSLRMYIDTQAFDNSKRSFFQLACSRIAGPTFPVWRIVNNAGTFVDVTGSNHTMLGTNENKWGMVYVRLSVDLQANSGLGGYLEMQIADHIIDLTGMSGQSATQSPQYDGTNLITDFNGGLNIGLGINRNTAVAGGCQLFADDIVYSVSNSL